MSSAQVRSAVTGFFKTAAIPGLNAVHPAPPYWADGSEWDLANSLGSGAIAAVHLVEDDESRITVPVLTGQKIVNYTIGLLIFYQWLIPSASLTPVDESSWVGPLDVIIDGVKTRLRSDPNCGMPSVVWQSAQDVNDVKIKRDLPRMLPGKVVSWNVVEFRVAEIITD
jgi:hypothetical protein